MKESPEETVDAVQASQSRRVAVIAVHGVADQHPGDTAKEVAQQLSALSQFDPQAAHYSAWSHEPLRIAVTPVPLAPFETPKKEDDRTGYTAFLHSEFALQYFGARTTREPALEFMSKKLSGYRGDSQNQGYELTRLCGQRLDGPSGRVTAAVDIYEMYWADLSRLGTGVLRVLGEFYQLLFHLTILGRLTVDLARAALTTRAGVIRNFKWFMLSELQAMASWVLSVPIALLNLILILLATVALPLAVPHEWRPLAAALVYGALVGVLVGAYRLRSNRAWASAWGAFFGAVTAALVFWYLCAATGNTASLRFGATHALALAWCLAVAAATALIARALGRQVPVARRFGGLLAVAVAGVFAVLLLAAALNTRDHVTLITMRVVDAVFLTLLLLWIVLAALHLGTWIFGALAWFRADVPGRRAIRTGRIAIAVPAGLFLVVTLAVWAALKGTIVGSLPDVDYRPLWENVSVIPLAPAEYVDRLLEMSAGRGFNVLFLLMIAGMLCMVWAVLPALLAELSPPPPLDEARSRGMGDWLDEGIGWGTVGVALLVFAVVFWLPFAPRFMDAAPGLKAFSGHTMLIVIAGILTGSAVGIIAFSRYTDVLLKGVRAVLDIALDVDQWLREQPNERTPTARMCARYASLLRHIIEWRGPDGHGYDGIVIVSHSQGTVITTELLRFIRAGYVEPHDVLNRLGHAMPVRLLTVGSPLRQLYSRRFPHLYAWAADPVAAEVGVERWTNAYFSGDYVGRYLWRSDKADRNWNPVQEWWVPGTPHPDVDAYPDGRTEFCLGAGAHTHYFDGTSRLVARAADGLIAG